MGTVGANISMSLDGYIAGPNDSDQQPLGDGGRVLFRWMGQGEPERMDVIHEQFASLGALVCGRRGFDVAAGWGEEPPFHCPIFVVTHHARDFIDKGDTTFTFVTDGFERAVDLAREAADDKAVALHGGTPIEQGIATGVLDEFEINHVPVLLGAGRRLFEHLGDTTFELEPTRVLDRSPDVVHINYRVVR